jgi:hypothetical protein
MSYYPIETIIAKRLQKKSQAIKKVVSRSSQYDNYGIFYLEDDPSRGFRDLDRLEKEMMEPGEEYEYYIWQTYISKEPKFHSIKKAGE